MIISEIEREESELKIYLEECVKKGIAHKYKTTTDKIYKSSGNDIVIYPNHLFEILDGLNTIKECIVYESYRDGWGCNYTFINAVVVL